MDKLNELRALAADIAKNPSQVMDMDLEQAAQLRRELDPLGNIVSNKGADSKKNYINLGIVNWRDRYLRKLLMTTFVGFVYRMLEEYEPEAELAKLKANYERKAARATKNVKDQLKSEYEDRVKQVTSTTRDIVKQFLDRNFEYDPDRHLRGAHVEGKEKPNAVDMMTSSADRVTAALQANPDNMFKYMRGHLLSTYQSTIETSNTIATVIELLNDPTVSTEDQQGILLKKYASLMESAKDMSVLAEPLAAADTMHAWNVNPPAEAFHQIDRYLVNHYEQLRSVVGELYSERADIEFGVVIHGVHKSAEEAANYRVQHRDEFRTDVFAVESGAVTLIGPFKENRTAVEYYNKNTEVLRLMQSQLEADHKLGEDLMKKKARFEKRKNINEAGGDEPGIKEYTKTINVVRDLGGKKILTKEEQDELVEAKKKADAIKQDYEVPDDCIQVDVFAPVDGKLVKSHFYTDAEPPVFMEEGSPFSNQYLPKREEGQTLESSYTTKTAINEHGKQVIVSVPVETEKK